MYIYLSCTGTRVRVCSCVRGTRVRGTLCVRERVFEERVFECVFEECSEGALDQHVVKTKGNACVLLVKP